AVDALLVGGVREEGAVRAAAVVGSLAVDAVAAATEDARPTRAQPGEVGPDHVLRVGGIRELHPLPDEVEPDLARHRHRHAGHATPRDLLSGRRKRSHSSFVAEPGWGGRRDGTSLARVR